MKGVLFVSVLFGVVHKRANTQSTTTLSSTLKCTIGTIDLDFNSGKDFYNKSSGELVFHGPSGFMAIFTDDDSDGSFGGQADGVHITNTNFGNRFHGSTTNFVLGAVNNNASATANYHSSGIVVRFNQGAVAVRFDDTDDDRTKKALFAFDESGKLIGQSDFTSQVPVQVQSERDCGGNLIYAVEFDTLAGPAGGSNDGVYFTIDNFHAEGVDSCTQVTFSPMTNRPTRLPSSTQPTGSPSGSPTGMPSTPTPTTAMPSTPTPTTTMPSTPTPTITFPSTTPSSGPSSQQPTHTPTRQPSFILPPTQSSAPSNGLTNTPTTTPFQSPTKSKTTGPSKTQTKSPTTPSTSTPSSIDVESSTWPPSTAPSNGRTITPTTAPFQSPTKSKTTSPTMTQTKSPTRPPTSTPSQLPSSVDVEPSTWPPSTVPSNILTDTPTKTPFQSPTKSKLTSPTKSQTSFPTTTPPTSTPSQPPSNEDVGLSTWPPSANKFVAQRDDDGVSRMPTYGVVLLVLFLLGVVFLCLGLMWTRKVKKKDTNKALKFDNPAYEVEDIEI